MMDIPSNEGGRIGDWWEGTPESVEGNTYREGQNFSEGEVVNFILANRVDPPSFPPIEETLVSVRH